MHIRKLVCNKTKASDVGQTTFKKYLVFQFRYASHLFSIISDKRISEISTGYDLGQIHANENVHEGLGQTAEFRIADMPTTETDSALPDVLVSIPNPYYNNDKENETVDSEIITAVKNIYYE